MRWGLRSSRPATRRGHPDARSPISSGTRREPAGRYRSEYRDCLSMMLCLTKKNRVQQSQERKDSTQEQAIYWKPLSTFVTIVTRSVPMPRAAVTITMEMPPAIRAYSIAVAARVSDRNSSDNRIGDATAVVIEAGMGRLL